MTSDQLIAAPASGRILVAGDTHGNSDWIDTLCRLAARHGVDVVLILGDFGMWTTKLRRDQQLPNSAAERFDHKFIGHVARNAERRGVRIRFLDGNHDNHPDARELYPTVDSWIRPIVAGTLDWADRGSIWTWDDVTFGALGGAVSSDRHHPTKPRRPGVDWWDTEQITDDELARLNGRRVDILCTHDAPRGIPLGREIDDMTLAADDFDNRDRVRQAVDITRPQLVLHGHHHQRHTTLLTLGDGSDVRVEGFGCDSDGGDAWAILTLDDFDVADGRELQRRQQAAHLAARSRTT